MKLHTIHKHMLTKIGPSKVHCTGMYVLILWVFLHLCHVHTYIHTYVYTYVRTYVCMRNVPMHIRIS